MIEIERKFLVDSKMLSKQVNPSQLTLIRITQGYLNQDPERTVRIRLGSYRGFITVKGKSTDDGLSRFEWEKEIDVEDAKALMLLCTGIIDKSRYVVNLNDKIWEIDIFHGDNTGLIVAEVELTSETECIILPEWITQEVTGDPKYYNSNLSANPYKDW